MRRFVIAAIAVLALAALVVGVVGFLLRDSATVALALSSPTVHAGDVLTITASHLPASQNGEIQLLSVLSTFPFTADGNGNVSVDITVPAATGIGDHTVNICWSGACHAHTTLVVTAAAALPSPSPTATPVAKRPAITLSTSAVTIGGRLTISGHNFDSGKRATVAIYQKTTRHLLVSAPIDVRSDGTFVITVKIPSAVRPGAAEIVACIYNGPTVAPTPSQCAARPVVVT